MKVKLNTNLLPIFSGTYNTHWGLEGIDHYLVEDEGKYPEYKHEDLMDLIQEAYNDESQSILSELPDWVESIEFAGHYSPREYNFKTDQLDFEVKIDKQAMLKKAITLINDNEFESWLNHHYKSRSGFISYTPNTPQALLIALGEGEADCEYDVIKYNASPEYFEQALGALLRYLSDCEEIQQGVYGEFLGNYVWSLEYEVKDV